MIAIQIIHKLDLVCQVDITAHTISEIYGPVDGRKRANVKIVPRLGQDT